MGCGIPANGWYDHFIFPQRFSSGDYLFVYADGDNNVVGLIHSTLDSEDTPEYCVPDEYMVDTMGDNIMEEMERKNRKICDDSDSSFGE